MSPPAISLAPAADGLGSRDVRPDLRKSRNPIPRHRSVCCKVWTRLETAGEIEMAMRMKRVLYSVVASCALAGALRSEEHTSELQSRRDLVCRLLLEKKKKKHKTRKESLQNKKTRT